MRMDDVPGGYVAALQRMIGAADAGCAALQDRAYAYGYDLGLRVLRPRLHRLMGLRCPWCGATDVAVHDGDCLICGGCQRALVVARRA